MANTVLLTGISGFVAKHVMLTLLERGYDVRGTVRSPSKIGAVEAVARKAGFDPARVRCVTGDLTSDEGWTAAAAGCSAVIHTASPFPISSPKDQKAFVPQARDGTIRVLSAAQDAGIDRVVLTSSIVAIGSGHEKTRIRTFSEDDWSNLGSPMLPAYPYSKTVAERTAWDMADKSTNLKLTVINPGFVQGPLLDDDYGTSGETVRMMLAGKYPGVPNIDFSIVDVRDVALAHVRALEVPEAEGERIICTSGNMTMMDMSRSLAAAFPAYRRKLPKFTLPDFAIRMMGLVDRNAAGAVPELGRQRVYKNEKARHLLGIDFRAPADAVVAMGQSLVDLKIV
jgi:nucleoside-diphosphate-sugar epimerase